MSSVAQIDRTYAALVIGGWSPTRRLAPRVGEELDPLAILQAVVDDVGSVSASEMFRVDHDTVLAWLDGIFPRREIWSRLTAVTGTTIEQWERAATRDREARWARANRAIGGAPESDEEPTQ